MKLIVHNFGPIREGKIDLSNRFYLFVGYNNSGKTYISQLLWSIFNKEIIEEFAQWAHEKVSWNKAELNEDFLQEILDLFADFIAKQAIPHIFNAEENFFDKETLVVKFEPDFEKIYASPWDMYYASLNSSKEVLHFHKKDNSWETFIKSAVHTDTSIQTNPVFALDFLIRLLFKNTHHTLFLPANRIFFPTFYKYIFQLERSDKQRLQQEVSRLGSVLLNNQDEFNKALTRFMDALKSPYTQPMGKLFDKLYELNSQAEASEVYREELDKLIQVIGGNIVMRKVEGLGIIEFFLQTVEEQKEVPMYLSSSSVNQLATLYLYFKYWVEKENNMLVIDEPEENLHPQNQLTLLNILLEFAAKQNNRVLMTTHSPLMTDALNNYLYWFFLKEKNITIEELDVFPDINLEIDLKLDDIGVYYFTGDSIENYKLEDYGVYFDDFRREIKKVKNIGAVLTDKIYEYLNEEED